MLIQPLECMLNMTEMFANYYYLLKIHEQRNKSKLDEKLIKKHQDGVKLRNWLLSLKPMQPFAIPSYLKEQMDDKRSDNTGLAYIFANFLADWHTQSRRVYSLPGHLSQIFPVIKMENITWKEITFPFNCFCIIPERALIGPEGERYQCILVSVEKKVEKKSISILLLSDKITVFSEPGPASDLIKLHKSRHHWSQIMESVSYGWYACFGMTFEKDDTISKTIEYHAEAVEKFKKDHNLTEHSKEFLRSRNYDGVTAEAVRLVCGFMQYLQMEDIKKEIQVKSPIPRPNSFSGIKKLSDTTEIACVGNVLKLAPNVIKILDESYERGEPTRSLSPTFVNSYWRAPWGGLKKNLPKSVLIGPFFRGFSLLDENENAVGTLAELA